MTIPPLAVSRLGAVDMMLLTIFIIGIYLGVEIYITPNAPLPAAPAGVAGLILLWRRRNDIQPMHLTGLLGVILIYLVATLSASDPGFLSKRFTGFLQLAYSLVIGYALILTLLGASRQQLAGLFLTLCISILAGCLLETYGGLRPVSDAVRGAIYSYGVYDSDLRDQLLYGRVRPKLFTSEPSAVTFGYTLCSFCWFVLSQRRGKLLILMLLTGGGLIAMPGPTLLLALPLVVPYYLFVAPYVRSRAGIVLLCALMLVIAGMLGATVYAERLSHILAGEDPSFFYRVIGPAQVAFKVMEVHPWAGAGLTGEPFIVDLVMNVFVRSSQYSAAWSFDRISSALTNYFWLHWIYLGAVWGVIAMTGLSIWLRLLGVPSLLFCWTVWAVFGQASGAYVGPKTWTVFMLAAAVSIIARRGLPAMPPEGSAAVTMPRRTLSAARTG
jgi:hypothetical protein